MTTDPSAAAEAARLAAETARRAAEEATARAAEAQRLADELAAQAAAAAAPAPAEPGVVSTSSTSEGPGSGGVVSTSSTSEGPGSGGVVSTSSTSDGGGSGGVVSTSSTSDGGGEANAVPALTSYAETVRAGYAFDGPALELGALVDGGAPRPEVPVRIPLAMLNRHGLVAGATGTGKTKTLQVLAEQVAAAGVPVFAVDVKGDLSGIAVPGAVSDVLTARAASVGQQWTPAATATEFLTLGGHGQGIPVRASVGEFGPVMLAKVLGLTEVQESSLGLLFHHAREAQLPLVDLGDLRAVLTFLVSDEGKPVLKEIGGISPQTAGVLLRELTVFADQGADAFFGEPSYDVADLLRTTDDGRGVVSLLEVRSIQDRPALFSTFLMHLLSRLYAALPEVGDVERPRLVFFFDEAHLLFKDASKDFLEVVVQTVRLIRSKGVGVFFVTQTPKDVPADVLAQLGSRVQHQLRVHTPQDAKALKATVSTYPTSDYDLGELLTGLAIGEAVVTVMDERGAPTPVAHTRLRAPQGSMDPAPEGEVVAAVARSPLREKYGQAVDPHSAEEILAARADELERAAQAAQQQAEAARRDAELAKEQQRQAKEREAQDKRDRAASAKRASQVERVAEEAAKALGRELAKSIFGRR